MKRLLALLLLAAVTVARADDSKISPELRNLPSNQQVQVIVQYAPGTQLNCSGIFGFLGCALNAVLNLAGTILGQLPLINGVVALLDGNGIQNLSNQSNVVYISQDRPLTPSDNNANEAIDADFAWQSNYTGAGVGVALIDSGVNNHSDLYQGILPFTRVVYQKSFVPGNSNAADQYGHGTHIAGLIAGDGLNSTGWFYTRTFTGVAPGANIINLRVLDANVLYAEVGVRHRRSAVAGRHGGRYGPHRARLGKRREGFHVTGLRTMGERKRGRPTKSRPRSLTSRTNHAGAAGPAAAPGWPGPAWRCRPGSGSGSG